MRWFKAAGLGLIVLCAWTATLFVATPVHQLVFRLTPTELAGRAQLDHSITRYLLTANQSALGVLTIEEQSHMADVRSVWLWLVSLSLVGFAWLGWSKPFVFWREALVVVALLGLFTLLGFVPAFEAVHQVVFPGGNWQFPDQSLLLQTYPIAFFVWMWGTIVVASAVSLSVSQYLYRGKRHELR